MKIRSTRPPQNSRLGPMRNELTGGRLFFPFCPVEFRGLNGRRGFNFVFCASEERKLAVGPTDEMHRKIAQAVFLRKVNKSEGFGGQLVYQERGGAARYTLTGRSGFYGQPTLDQLKIAADYIASELTAPVITSNHNSVTIEAPLE
jgi:hypothetical protein